MGSKWFAGGVVAAPHGRIQFDFTFEGVRYRPSIQRPPSEKPICAARTVRLDWRGMTCPRLQSAPIDES
jgi:hypothetical protein